MFSYRSSDLKRFFLLGKLQACTDFKMNIPLFNMGVDFSQPSIFSYFYSIVERAEGIARELDASAKRFAHFLFRVR